MEAATFIGGGLGVRGSKIRGKKDLHSKPLVLAWKRQWSCGYFASMEATRALKPGFTGTDAQIQTGHLLIGILLNHKHQQLNGDEQGTYFRGLLEI